MAGPRCASAILAGLALVSTAHAQPVVSPQQTEPSGTAPTKPGAIPAADGKPVTKPDGAPAKASASTKPEGTSATTSTSDKPDRAPAKTNGSNKPDAAPTKTSARPTGAKPTTAKPATTAKSPTKPSPAKRPASTTAKSRAATKNAKTAKATKATKKPKPLKSSARVVASGKRGPRGDNMPRGFDWPPTPEMNAAATACEADLATLGVGWMPASPEGHIAAPIELTNDVVGTVKYTSKWRRPPHVLDCHLARALAEVGPELYALGVREVRWGSIFRWSNVRTGGRELPFLSRHALGLAMDIVEFIDENGRVANVQQHYMLGDPLLLAIENAVNASGKFRIVLTPKNDPKSHDDHFHIEANPSYSAR